MSDKSSEFYDIDRSEPVEPSAEMIVLYLRHVPDYLADFLSALHNHDQEQMDFQCHKMCSAMRTMGFENIAINLERIKDKDVASEEVQKSGAQIEAMIGHTFTLLQDS